MAIKVSLTVSNPNPVRGETIHVAYEVVGNDPIPGATLEVNGNVTVGQEETPRHVVATIVIDPVPAAELTFETPTIPGTNIVFTPTENPEVFSAVML